MKRKNWEKIHATKKFGYILLLLAFFATIYALFCMTPPHASTQAVLIQRISPQQEAIVMTSGLFLVLGFFCVLSKK